MSYVIRAADKGLPAQRRYGQVLGWCYAMRWVYDVQGWSKQSKVRLESIIRKLEESEPNLFQTKVVVRNVDRKQRKFLEWACEHLGITPL